MHADRIPTSIVLVSHIGSLFKLPAHAAAWVSAMLALTLCACGGSDTPPPKPATKDTLSVVMGDPNAAATNPPAPYNDPSSPNNFTSMTSDSEGNVFMAFRCQISKLGPDGIARPFVGSKECGYADGVGSQARFGYYVRLATDRVGNLYVGDTLNHTIRKVSPTGMVSTLSGVREPGYVDGDASRARFIAPRELTVDRSGVVYVVDGGLPGESDPTRRVRKVWPDGSVITPAFAPLNTGQGGGTRPGGIAVDGHGNLFLAVTRDVGTICIDRCESKPVSSYVLRITPAGERHVMAGSETAPLGAVDGPGADSRFFCASDIAIDDNGNIYVADVWNRAVRRVSATGVVSTVAGRLQAPTAEELMNWDGGVAQTGTLPGRLRAPEMIAIAPGNALYISAGLPPDAILHGPESSAFEHWGFALLKAQF